MVDREVSDCGLPHDRTIGNHNYISSSAFNTDRIIHCFMPIHPSKISIRRTFNLQQFLGWFHDQSLIRSSFQIATNSVKGMFMHKLWTEHISCRTVDNISNVRVSVSSKIQRHSSHTAVDEMTRGRIYIHIFGKKLPSGRCELSICSSIIEAKSFQYLFDQTFLCHIKKSSISIALNVNSKKSGSIILLF